MIYKRLRWILYPILPLTLLLLPLTIDFHFTQLFKTIVLNPQKTGISTLNYYDHSRNRPLITEVWYPVDLDCPSTSPTGFWIRCNEARDAPISKKEKHYPLILISHGFGGDRYNMSWLAEALAANGYIVAAMDHYGNTWNNKIPELFIRPWERPKDISFVLDQLLIDPHFKDYIDINKIGFAGYSLGGATGIWIAGAEAKVLDKDLVKAYSQEAFAGAVPPELVENTDFNQASGSFRDSRISAVFVMAPALGWLFTETSLNKIDVPVFIIALEHDNVVPTDTNAQLFANKIARATLKILPGEATHYVFLNRVNVVGKRFLNQRYCEDPASIDRGKTHQKICKNSISFFDNSLK